MFGEFSLGPFLATGRSAQMRVFATGVGSKADIGGPVPEAKANDKFAHKRAFLAEMLDTDMAAVPAGSSCTITRHHPEMSTPTEPKNRSTTSPNLSRFVGNDACRDEIPRLRGLSRCVFHVAQRRRVG